MSNIATRPATQSDEAPRAGTLGLPPQSRTPRFRPVIDIRRSALGDCYRYRLFDNGHRCIGMGEEPTRLKAIESACELAEQLLGVA